MMSSIVRYCEKTMTLCASFRSFCTASKQASTLVDVRQRWRSIFWRIDARPRREPLPAPSTRATRFMGARQSGHGSLRAWSAATQAAHAQTWPQLKSIVSRGACARPPTAPGLTSGGAVRNTTFG